MLEFSIKKKYSGFELDLTLKAENETVVILAPSGGGKSLTLNCLSGIIPSDEGKFVLNGRVLFDKSTGVSVPIKDRKIGYIFQDYALFPHKTVRENIDYGMNSDAEFQKLLEKLISKFNLNEKLDLLPDQLSGGEKQRTAILRAIASNPDVLFFDEPLSALDVQLRESLLKEIKEVITELKLPVLYVTHNLREAEYLADRIAVMRGGKLVEFASKEQILMSPQKVFTAEFLGVKNIFECSYLERRDGNDLFRTSDGLSISTTNLLKDVKTDEKYYVCVNPKDVRLKVNESHKGNDFYARVEEMNLLERNYRVVLQVVDGERNKEGFRVFMDIEEMTCAKYKLGLKEIVGISLRPDRVFICTA